MDYFKKLFLFMLVVFSFVFVGKTFSQINSKNRHWCVYYGWPSLVEDPYRGLSADGDTSKAADIFDDYSVVVFNGMVEQSNESTFSGNEAAKDTVIINKLHDKGTTKVFGYIAIGGSQTADPPAEGTNFLKSMIDDWIDEYNVDGFFFDEAGFDYGAGDGSEMRPRQVAVINYVHQRLTNQSGTTLVAIMNAWDWDDIYTKLPGNPVPMEKGDGFFLENWVLEGSDDNTTLKVFQKLTDCQRSPNLLLSVFITFYL